RYPEIHEQLARILGAEHLPTQLRDADVRPGDVGKRRVQPDRALHLRAHAGTRGVPDLPSRLVLRNTSMTTTISSGTSVRAVSCLTALGAVLLLASCQLDVTNPGPIQAEKLDDTKALASVVNGAGRDLAEALNWIAYTGG